MLSISVILMLAYEVSKLILLANCKGNCFGGSNCHSISEEKTQTLSSVSLQEEVAWMLSGKICL